MNLIVETFKSQDFFISCLSYLNVLDPWQQLLNTPRNIALQLLQVEDIQL